MSTQSRTLVVVGFVLCLALPQSSAVASPTTDGAIASATTDDDATIDARCRRLRAAADSTADLLDGPSIGLQLLHVPRAGGAAADPDPTLRDDGYTARAVVSFAPLDLLRARKVRRAADASCDAARAAVPVTRVLAQGASYGRAAALRAQLEVYDQHADRVDELLADARDRRDRQVDTVLELDELVLRTLRLRRERAAAGRDLAALEAQGDDQELTAATWAALADHDRAVLDAEREQSSLRRLSGWQVDVQLGAVPGAHPDWYGLVSLSIDLGTIGQRRAERRYLAARRDEVAGADTELRGRLDAFRRTLAAGVPELEDELALVDEQLALITAERTQLAARAADRWTHQDAALELDAIALEAQHAYLAHLLASHRTASPPPGTEP